MLAKFTDLLSGLVVDNERMQTNLDQTRGLVFSQAVLLALVESGTTRDDAYRIVQRNALKSWDDGPNISDLSNVVNCSAAM